MLSRIHIQNIGIIEDVEIEFDNKINVLTGETGSGKTLILDSINLATGNRVSKDIIRNGCEYGLIEVCFLAEIPDVSEDGMVILSRQIYANGKNICKVNGRMATLTQLKNIGDVLIDIHGQHDNIYLLNPNMYMDILDSYISEEFKDIKEQYMSLVQERKEIAKKRIELCADPQERQRKLELLNYQLDDIDKSNLKIGEEESLIEEKNLFKNYEKIFSGLSESSGLIDNATLKNVQNAVSRMANISSYDNKYNEIYSRLEELYYNLEDCSSCINEEISKLEFNPNRQQEVMDRLDEIFGLKRKYGNSIEDILKYRENIANEIDELMQSENIIKELEKKYLINKKHLFDICMQMHEKRVKAANVLKQKIDAELQDLEMKKAVFDIILTFNNNVKEYDEQTEYSFNEDGLDKVEFNICTNVGSKPQSIGKIVSGGELSRLTLALKTVLVNTYNIPTIIFDEIDTGLSGQACVSLGEKIKLISKKHQVIIVTHHPNIAAVGTENLFVSKNVKNGKTASSVKVLNEEEKIQEIARILNGKEITKIALEHAKELVDENK